MAMWPKWPTDYFYLNVATHLSSLSLQQALESLSLSCRMRGEFADAPLAGIQHLSSRSTVIREAWLVSGPWQACERSNIPVYTRSAQCDRPWDAWTQIPNPCFCCQHVPPVHLQGFTKSPRFRCCLCLLFLIQPFVLAAVFWSDRENNCIGTGRMPGPKWAFCHAIKRICEIYKHYLFLTGYETAFSIICIYKNTYQKNCIFFFM